MDTFFFNDSVDLKKKKKIKAESTVQVYRNETERD